MKLMFEEAYELESEVIEDLNEATGKSSKKYKIKGLFTTTEEKNRNSRIYPKALFEREVNNYQKEILNNSPQSLMELEHPARSSIDIMEAVAKCTKLEMKGNKVFGEAVLLDNPKANQLKTLIDNGIKIGVSSRGLGKVKDGIVESYKLLNYDIVQQPSNHGSFLNGMVESYTLNEGIIEDKEYEVLEDGTVNEVQICTESICHKVDKEVAQKAITEKLEAFIEDMKK